MLSLVSAAMTTALPDGAPAEIVYIPEGAHTITPFVDGKPKQITVTLDPAKGASVAAKLQADLTKRQGENVRPWVDFDHEGKVSAGNPDAFRYEPGKGIVMAIGWSNTGKAAVEGKDFSYFSPSFLIAEDGTPSGLDDRGPIGSLVNEPAFRQIPRIAAKDGGRIETKNVSTMSAKILATLGIDPAHADAESAAVSKIEAQNTELAAIRKERDELKTKLDAADAKSAADRKDRAKTLVDAALADGRIAPKDEETANDFREKIEAGDAFAEKMLAKLPKSEDPSQPIVKAGDTAPTGSKERRIDAAEAKARNELGSGADFARVWERAKEIDPPAFAE